MVSEARVLARLLKNGDDGEPAIGEVGGGSEKAGCEGERFDDRSDCADMDRDVIGTVRWLMLRLDERGLSAGFAAGVSGDEGGI